MATHVLCRRVPRLRYLTSLRKDFTKAQHVYVKGVDETDEEEGKKGVRQHQEASLGAEYSLSYKPSSYHSVWNSAASLKQTDSDEDECFSTFAPSFWQQSNHYSVNCSRHLFSTKNTRLDLAFNISAEPTMPPASVFHCKSIPPDVKVDTRGFHKCRPEYASMTLPQRPQPIKWDEAMQLLQEVTVLKGSMKPSHVSQFLTQLSHLHPDRISLVLSDQRFIMLLRYSVEHLRSFTLLQLLEVLQGFVWLEVPSSHSVLGLYEAELSRRADQMSLHQLLLVADLWRCIGRQVPQFLRCLHQSVRVYHGKMEIPELVQLLYILGEGRHCPKDLIHSLEQLLMLHLHQLHPEEVGTVCLAFFKSQTSLSDDAVTGIVDKAHSFVDEMSDFAIANVMKFLRFNYLCHKAWLEAMALEIPQRAHRMGIQGLMHVVLSCSALHYRNDKILMAIAERVPSLAPHCRSKDACKLLWAFATLGFLPHENPALYPSLTEALRQKKVEFQRFPEHLLTGLLGLAFVSQFPEDLIALALSPEFINLAMKSTQLDLTKDLITLDGTVALELPHWTGPRLNEKMREEVTEKLWNFAQSDLCLKPEVQEAESVLQDVLGGKEFVCKKMILPHTRSIDLEVHLDSTGNPKPVKPESETANLSPDDTSSKSDQGLARVNVGVSLTEDLLAQLTNTKNAQKPSNPKPKAKPPTLQRFQADEQRSVFCTGLYLTNDIKDALIRPRKIGSAPQESNGTVKLAIQIPNRNYYCYHSQQLLGLHAMKRRQLMLAGYRVVELGYKEWSSMLKKSRTEKVVYMHHKVYNSLL